MIRNPGALRFTKRLALILCLLAAFALSFGFYVRAEKAIDRAHKANIGLIAWLKDDVGPWLWNRMQWVLADKAEGKKFADLILVEGFGRGVLQKLAGEYPGFFSVVDFSGVTGIDQDSD